MCSDLEISEHVFLSYGEAAGWRMNFNCAQWLNYHQYIVIGIVIVEYSSKILKITYSI